MVSTASRSANPVLVTVLVVLKEYGRQMIFDELALITRYQIGIAEATTVESFPIKFIRN